MTKNEFKHKVFSLSEKIYPLVVRMLGKSNAEDAIQDIMMKLWVKRHKLGQHPSIKGLVIITARNHCIDIIRKTPLTVKYDNLYRNHKDSRIEHESIEFSELNGILNKLLEKLPQQQREVFEMRDIDGFETEEIADTLTIAKEHVRVLLSRARKQIREALEKTYDYERGAY